jgi:hypothetical protein
MNIKNNMDRIKSINLNILFISYFYKKVQKKELDYSNSLHLIEVTLYSLPLNLLETV